MNLHVNLEATEPQAAVRTKTALPTMASGDIIAQMCANDSPNVTKYIITLIKSNGAPLSKSFSVENGAITKRPAASVILGVAARDEIEMSEVATVLETLSSDTAMTCGSFDPSYGDAIDIGTVGRLSSEVPTIARTNENFKYPEGPALMMLDHDEETHTADDLFAELDKILPNISKAPRIMRGSISSGVHLKGEALKDDPMNYHLYIGVADGSDIPRAGKVIHQRLILAGLGTVKVSSSGVPLIRSPIDAMVFQGSRLSFEGAAVILSDGLEYTTPKCRVANEASALLDTAEVLSLNLSERNAYDREITRLKDSVKDEVKNKRRDFTNLMIGQGTSAGSIETVLDGKALPADFIITLCDGREIPIKKILADPESFHGVKCYDLGAGVATGKCTRTVIYSLGRNPAIHDYRTDIQYALSESFDNIPYGYECTSLGVQEDSKRNNVAIKLRLASTAIYVESFMRDGDSNDWTMRIIFYDIENNRRELMMPRTILGSPTELIESLLDVGACINVANKSNLAGYLSKFTDLPLFRTTPVTGWFNDSFVLPFETINDNPDDPIIYKPKGAASITKSVERKGSFDEWKAGMTKASDMVIFSVCIALAGAWRYKTGVEAGGFHIFGETSGGC